MRRPVPVAPIVASLLLVACAQDDGHESAVPPNVVLISLDTLRYDHCSFNGYERETTPFLDELARSSLVFDRAYATMAWTLVSHISMLTGLYPLQHGVLESTLMLTPEFPTLSQRLYAEGYQNYGLFANGWLDDRFGFARGFVEYQRIQNGADADRRLPAILDSICENQILDTTAEGGSSDPGPEQHYPFFLFVHLFDVHSASFNDPAAKIYDPPAPFDSLWVPDAEERLADIDPRTWWDEECDPTPEQHEAVVALYDGGIRYVDDLLRRWFADMEARGLLENTLVIVTADHGEGLRQRGQRYGGHGGLQEEGLRVPLLIRFPDGRRAGERSAGVTSSVDLVPTVLDCLGLEADPRLPGRSLLGPPRSADEWIFAGDDNARSAISERYKVFYRDDGPTGLADLQDDPAELEVWRRYRDTAHFFERTTPLHDEFLRQFEAFYDPAAPPAVGSLDAAEEARLEALGYGGVLGAR